MKRDVYRSLRWICLGGLPVIVLAFLATQVHAAGAIGFLDPQHTTVQAGDPFSGMDLGTDWGNDGMNDYPTAPGGDGQVYAVPNLDQHVTLESWRTSTHLLLKFLIEDRTRFIHQAPGDNTLSIGDQIIIQIDPNKSGGAALENGGTALTRDHRFEIVLRDEAINAMFHVEPEAGGLWGEKLAVNGLATTCPLPVGFEGYCIEVSIPRAMIGNPTSDVGIAIAVVNDLGHGHQEGGFPVPDVTGTAFPLTMGFSEGSDPSLIEANLADGNWVHPSQWGVGYFSVAPGAITFSHSPAYWWSNSIRLGRCDAANWAAVQEPVTVGMDQLTLSNWYIYNPDEPCQMRIFFQAFKSGPGVVRGRLFVVWGRPGIAPQDWFPVQVTPPIAFANAEEFLDIIWPNVPAVDFTSHPCLRVYVLPENLTGAFDEAGLMAIDTNAELTAMEAHYSVPSGSPGTAQMNFNAISTGSCNIEGCQPVIIGRAPTEESKSILAPAFAQEQPSVPAEPAQEGRNLVRITAEGLGIELAEANRAYTIISPIGGIGWAIDNDRIDKEQRLELKVPVTNPPIAAWNFGVQPPKQITSPSRQLVVLVRSEATPGHPVPDVAVDQPEGLIQPGASIDVEVNVTPGKEPPGKEPPRTYWIVILIILIVLLWFFWRRRLRRS